MHQEKLEKILHMASEPGRCRVVDGRVHLGGGDAVATGTAGQSLAGRLQGLLKRHGRLYYFLLKAFSSVRISTAFGRELAAALERHGEGAVILNIGSGPSRLDGRGDVINVDLFAFDEVDVCIDPGPLPFKEGSADLVISIATLEHVQDPAQAMAEFHRVLKPGGELLCYLPFMQPFHAAPSDFQRWTEEGVKILGAPFTSVRTGIGAGPTSALLWVASEWLALVLSCGNSTLRSVLNLLVMAVTSPLKHLDWLLERRPAANVLASAFYLLARK